MYVSSISKNFLKVLLLSVLIFSFFTGAATAQESSVEISELPQLPTNIDERSEGQVYQMEVPNGEIFPVRVNEDGSYTTLTQEELEALNLDVERGADGQVESAAVSDSDPPEENFNAAQRLIYSFVLTAFGALALMTGVLMDQSINYFVLGFGHLYMNYFGGAVEAAWEVVRDIINITLIFGLVYIGFRLIFEGDNTDAKRNLVFLLLAALLVNFSLFFAKAIVDVTNAAAFQFADAVRVDGNPASTGVSFSGAYNAAVGLNTVLDSRDIVASIGNRGWAPWGYIFMLAVTLLIASFVYVSVAILLVIRFVALVFLLVFSPIMFLGFIFPFFNSISREWLRKFTSQAVLAPAMMLMLYVALLVTANIGTSVQDGRLLSSLTSGSVDANEATAMNLYTLFILGSGLMIGALIVASRLGSGFASSSVKLLDSGRQRVQRAGQRLAYGATIGAAAYGARSAGRATATGVGGTLRSTRGAAAQRKLDQFKAGQIHLSEREFAKAQKQAQSSYDPRQIGAWWKDKQKALDPVKGGRQQQIKDAQKAREKYDDGMGELKREDYGISDKDFKARAEELYRGKSPEEKAAFMKYAGSYNTTAREANELKQRIEEGGLTAEETAIAKKELKLKEEKLKAEESSFKFARQLAKLHAEEAKQAAAQKAGESGGDTGRAVFGTAAGGMGGMTVGVAAAALGAGGFGLTVPMAAGMYAGGKGLRLKGQGDRHYQESITASSRKRFGPDGSNMVNKKKQKEQAIATAEALKDNDALPTENSSSGSDTTKT